MISFYPEIDRWFSAKREYIEIFSKADTRIEGWFKAEMLFLLTQLVEKGQVSDFKREEGVRSPKSGKRKQVDFRINSNGIDHYCELKALCISQAAGTPRNLGFYFRDDHVGLIKDFRKLDELNIKNKWVLGFVYPSPDIASWTTVANALPSGLSHWKPITAPKSKSEPLFISLWQG